MTRYHVMDASEESDGQTAGISLHSVIIKLRRT